MGEDAAHDPGGARQLAQVPERLAVPGAHLRQRRHHAADAHGGPQVQDGRRSVPQDDGEAQDHRRRRRRRRGRGTLEPASAVQRAPGRRQQRPVRVPRDETTRVSQVLFPLQRRAPRDFIGN